MMSPNSSIFNESRFLKPNSCSALDRSLTTSKNQKLLKKCLIWGSLNAIIFAILIYDICNTCYLYLDYFNYAEYGLCFIVGLNMVYYSSKILVFSLKKNQICITSEQKRLLGINDNDPNFKIVKSLNDSTLHNKMSLITQDNLSTTPQTPLSTTPLNLTALSWQSNTSSLNYSLSSPSWTYHKPGETAPTSPQSFTFRDTSGIDVIADDSDLALYLKEFEANTSAQSAQNQAAAGATNLLSSFWSHPVTKTAKDMSTFLKHCTYQLAAPSPSGGSPKCGEKASPATHAPLTMVPWSQLNVEMVQLTQWNERLRVWISSTILERLIREFERINEALEKQALSDIKIGAVGLDRLRKTAQLAHVVQFIPSLPTIIPFLEVSANQEYLVKRVRQLAKGGCMSEFRWNGGAGHGGREWDEALPTDASIVMHLLASYLDTQLVPLPSAPDTKPFSGLHYIKCRDKMPVLTPSSLYVQQVSEKPPHYRVIVGETIHEMVKGYSNLFHCILYFLYHVKTREHGMLGRVNLGRAGVNMLWIIDQ